MKMSDERRIAEGIASWLHFEFCCCRGKVLDESALKSSVSQLLGALPATRGAMVHSNYAHPDLRRRFPRGRKPEVDYAVISKDGITSEHCVEYAIECKWADSSHASSIRIVKDLLRLVALRNLSGKKTECFFVLAGSIPMLDKVLSTGVFRNSDARAKLISKKRGMGKVEVDCMPETVKHGACAFMPDIKEFTLSCSGRIFNPEDIKELTFQAIVWRVR